MKRQHDDGAEDMRSKVLLICAVLLASMFMVVMSPVEAALSAEDYEITKYDPMDDVMRVRTGGDFKFSPHDNIEVKMISSEYDDGIPPKIVLKMKVEGQIKDHEDYKYAFTVIADGKEYVLAAYQSGAPVGFEMETNRVLIGVTASGKNTDTLTISCPVNQIGPPNNNYDVFGATLYSAEESERYVDLVPDKLILITEPSDRSTVSGDNLIIKGEIRQSETGFPSGNVKIGIDTTTDLEDVSGFDPWSYKLDTTSLTAGEHYIYVEIEDTEFSDKITIEVDQDTGNYESFSKTDNRFPNIGDYYEYTPVEDTEIVGISIPLTNEMTSKVTDLTRVEGKDVYQVESHSEGGQDLAFARYTVTLDRTSWKETEYLGTVKENTNSTIEIDVRDDTDVYTTTIYTPPLDNHKKLEVQVGFNNRWFFHTSADAESDTYVAGEDEPTHNSYVESLDLTGECLYHLSSYSVNDNNFQDIYVIRSYYENPGVSIVEYYSPEMGIPVQINTYDASRKLLFGLGVDDYFQPPFSVEIGGISFDPAKPEADTDNDIIVTVKNIGSTDATNVKVTVYDGDKQIEQKSISSLSSDQSTDEKFKWKPTAKGIHTIRVTLSYQNTVLDEEEQSVEVKAASTTDGIPISLILILIIIVVVVLVVVLLMRTRSKKAEEVPPAEAEEAEAAPAEAAAPEGGVVVASKTTAAQPAAAAQPQLKEEAIQCPSCKNGFTIQYQNKPVKVKCPNCGMEGVLN